MAAGLCLLILPEKNIVRARLLSAVSMAYLLTAVLVTAALTRCYDVSYTLFHLTASLPVCGFDADRIVVRRVLFFCLYEA